MPLIVTLGEALIDFVADVAGVTLAECPGFRKAPGGAPANVAVGVARLGGEAAFVGKVGDDPFGRFLVATLAAAGVDTRGIRYPGLISHVAPPGGGTTDYAVEIFHHALRDGTYTCFLAPDTQLDMMYMPDAVRAAIELMEADPARLRHRNAFNITAFQLTPRRLAEAIRRHLPHFRIDYRVDPLRQAIADSWPRSIDDSAARTEWGWRPAYDVDAMTADMIEHLAARLRPGHATPARPA